MRVELHRLVILNGVLLTVLEGVFVGWLVVAVLRDWWTAVQKRRQRILRKRLPSGRHAQIITPAPTPPIVLAMRAAKERERERLEQQFEMVWDGQND